VFAVFDSVARAALESFGSFHDESGDLSEWVARAVEGLGGCLQAESDATARAQILRVLAEQIGTWENVRGELLNDLRRKKQFGALTEIHLDAGALGAAIETVAPVQPGFGVGYSNLRITVAQAAEATYPRDALGLYARAAEAITEKRDFRDWMITRV
jgi:hypothetical protein